MVTLELGSADWDIYSHLNLKDIGLKKETEEERKKSHFTKSILKQFLMSHARQIPESFYFFSSLGRKTFISDFLKCTSNFWVNVNAAFYNSLMSQKSAISADIFLDISNKMMSKAKKVLKLQFGFYRFRPQKAR